DGHHPVFWMIVIQPPDFGRARYSRGSAKEQSVDERKDCGVSADTEREGDHDRRREPRRAAQLPRRVLQVVPDRFHALALGSAINIALRGTVRPGKNEFAQSFCPTAADGVLNESASNGPHGHKADARRKVRLGATL